ncbi:helix-turn-helix domain-containing protein [Lentzea roselyniae]|uniref:Helix-turn-helix domain-containing protein n=1 Tax=Lentzea roselyniae TaxID=531940 RepID=A0ABP7C5P4_9PSEU
MVKIGQPQDVTAFSFQNPDRLSLAIEVVTLGQMTHRLSPTTLAAVHRTDFHQLFLFKSGTGQAMVDFVNHPCDVGTVTYVHPGRVLRFPQPVPAFAPLDAYLVLFTPAFPPDLPLIRPVLSPFGPAVWHPGEIDREGVLHAAAELNSEYQRAIDDEAESRTTVELVRQLLGALLLRLARLPGDTGVSDHDENFRRFQEELEQSFTTTHNAAEYAARIGYSLRTLNRICQASTGSSAKALIDERVALEARRLLVHTTLPAAAIGWRLGFDEPSNFGKFFTRTTGLTPGAFRESQGC